MTFFVRSHLHCSLSYFQETIVRSFTPRQKTILLTAAAALGLLAACYAFVRCCLNDRAIVQKKLPDESKKEAEPIRHVVDQTFDSVEEPAEIKQTEDGLLAEVESIEPIIHSSPLLDTSHDLAEVKIESKALYVLPPLLNLGKTRISLIPAMIGNDEAPYSNLIERQKLWTTMFACCFHTSETHQEILQLLMAIQHKIDQPKSFLTLYKNLLCLHQSLPGKSEEKKMKIYWSKAAEEVLIPRLFKNAVDVNDILFAIIPGEPSTSPFQAEKMDFTRQLEFMAMDVSNVSEPLEDAMDQISKEVLGVCLDDLCSDDFLENNAVFISSQIFLESQPVWHACVFSLMRNCYLNLQALKSQNKQIDFLGMIPEEKKKLLKELFAAPKSSPFGGVYLV